MSQSTDLTCPKCGNYRDTPQHEFGCRRTFTIMITGSRDWPDKEYVWRILDQIVARERNKDPDTFFVLLHGGARGADEFAGAWANRRGVSEHVIHAKWRELGRAAGLIRNRQLIEMKPDIVCAFRINNSHGTTHALGLAEAAGIETFLDDRVMPHVKVPKRLDRGLQ